MEPTTAAEADYLDIVFNKRNKAYGGYELRRHYNRRMKKAGLFALLGVSALFSFSFIAINHRHTEVKPEFKTPVIICGLDMRRKIEPVLPKPAICPPPPAPYVKLFTPPVIATNDTRIDVPMTPVKGLANANPGVSNNNTDSLATSSGTGKLPSGTGVVMTAVRNEIPAFVEQMPQFDGDLNKYLAAHLNYPEQARAAGIEGRVGIQFVVNEDGTISNLKLQRGIGAGCDEEALRVIAAMPRWKPGKNNGVAVKVYFTQPITFKLE